MNGRLTTHVLDTVRGCPAEGVAIELWRLHPESGHRELVATASTNGEGRTDRPLLAAGELETGVYELVFAIGDYYMARSEVTSDPPFLDLVPVRFGVADPNAHYHVPLLVSPWAYSTYRGR